MFEEKFDSALATMIKMMAHQLGESNGERIEQTLVEGDYVSPRTSQVKKGGAFKTLQANLGQRKLVIHIDDCQMFFCGVVRSPTHTATTIMKKEVMALALRTFSRCITPFCGDKNIVWVFSGTRPTLATEITLTSGLAIRDISRVMGDFGAAEIQSVLGNYFRLEDATPAQVAQIPELCSRLSGPPKNLQFFLCAAPWPSLNCVQDLFDQWSSMESAAVEMYKLKIQSTLWGDLNVIARSLVLLHTTALASGNEFVEVPEISRFFVSLIEAGLLRVHRSPLGWKIFAPNRLLVSIFRQYVSWYTWENLNMLKAAIATSQLVHTLNGKVFELLFALELCNSPDCKLWKFLGGRETWLSPLQSWKPLIKGYKSH